MFGDILFILIIVLVVFVIPIILKKRGVAEVEDLSSPFLEGRERWWEEKSSTEDATDPSYSSLAGNIFHKH